MAVCLWKVLSKRNSGTRIGSYSLFDLLFVRELTVSVLFYFIAKLLSCSYSGVCRHWQGRGKSGKKLCRLKTQHYRNSH